jgi:hypothetical protein
MQHLINKYALTKKSLTQVSGFLYAAKIDLFEMILTLSSSSNCKFTFSQMIKKNQKSFLMEQT